MEALVVRSGTTTVVIPASELTWTASRASGPGGQNVNKVASKVELRFDVGATNVLLPSAKARLVLLAGNAIDSGGVLHVVSQLTRDQSQNLEDARGKLQTLVARALVVPKKRRATKPTRGSTERRLQSKREGSERKASRSKKPGRDD